jgi:toxin ParE1/3/4
MRLQLSHRARADLDAIWEFTARRCSTVQAERYYHDIADAIHDLTTGQRRGRELGFGEVGWMRLNVARRFLSSGKHELHVRRVLHQSMDAKRHLRMRP